MYFFDILKYVPGLPSICFVATCGFQLFPPQVFTYVSSYYLQHLYLLAMKNVVLLSKVLPDNLSKLNLNFR